MIARGYDYVKENIGSIDGSGGRLCIWGGQTSINVPWLSTGIGEAAGQPHIDVAQRELKRYKGHKNSNLYNRAHEIIYKGDKPSYDGRTKIAVVITGDENIVVEDRIKNQIYSQLRKKFPYDYFAVYKGTDINSMLLQYAEDIYYDEREYATTRDTEFDVTRSNTGVNISANVSKSISDANARANADSASAGASGGSDLHIFGGSVSAGFGKSGMQGEESRVTKSSKVDIDGMPVGNRPRGLADMRREDYVRAGQECGYDYVFVLSMSNGKGRTYSHDLLLTSTNTVTKNVWLRVRLVDVNSGNYLYRNDIPAMGKTHNGHINGRVLERSVAKAMQEAMDDISVSER